MKTNTTVAVVVVVALLALAAGAVYLLSGPTGTVVMRVTDSPVSNVSHVYLTITGVSFQGESNGSASYSVNSTRFDLLALVNVTKLLGKNTVPTGNYTMIRFTVSSAIATISGSNVTLTVPSGQVKVPTHFEVKSGKTTTIVLDITADMTNISASSNFRPVVTVKTVTGPS